MTDLRVLLLIPPLTQLNTPYPSTAYLTGFLRAQGIPCAQADLGIEMVLRLFSRTGLRSVFNAVRSQSGPLPREARLMLADEARYLATIDQMLAFLQGRDAALASDLARPGTLPQGPRFKGRKRFPRSVPEQDRAKQWATFCLEDLADLIQAVVSPHFALSRYGEHIARSASSFDVLESALSEPPTLTDTFMLDACRRHVERVQPQLVGLSVPFPGNLYGAFRVAQAVKQRWPHVPIVLGGGYVNTELRRLNDPRVFDYVDFITLDDGERPLLSVVEHVAGRRPRESLCRTFYRDEAVVRFANDSGTKNFSMNAVGCPTYQGLKLERYFTVLDSTNPMHRLWSEGHWNKLTVAHGCYWKQCTFCDVGLDYIGRYEPTPTDRLIGHIEQLIDETGRRDFHFVDEAAPPAGLKAMALGLLERGLTIRWWGNIRFEETFAPDLCRLLAASGCIAVSAGLEAASDRVLDKMKKGITVDQTALVAAGFRDAGILIHAYLMYGFPSETLQETIDSLERVRQLFAANLLQSGFWHRFTATAHSPIGLHPKAHGITILGPRFAGFAENDLRHRDDAGQTPDWLGAGLRRSMLNFLEGRGLAMDVRDWFDHPVPRPRVPSNWLPQVLNHRSIQDDPTVERKMVWLGKPPVGRLRGDCSSMTLTLSGWTGQTCLTLPGREARWLSEVLRSATPAKEKAGTYPRIHDAMAGFPGDRSGSSAFLRTPAWQAVRRAGLLLV